MPTLSPEAIVWSEPGLLLRAMSMFMPLQWPRFGVMFVGPVTSEGSVDAHVVWSVT